MAFNEQFITKCSFWLGFPIYFTIVYASMFYKSLHLLRDSLVNLNSIMVHPWIVMGDFNVIMEKHEKIGITPISVSCIDFRNTVEVCNLLEVKTKGTFFTWARKGLHCYSESKLDRAFCSSFGVIFGIIWNV